MKNEKTESGVHLSFLIMILINVFCFQEKVFILMNILMNEKV